MRRESQEILPGLFIGPYQSSRDLEALQKQGITHICCIYDKREAPFVKPRFPDNFVYLALEVRDSLDQNLIRLFPEWVPHKRVQGRLRVAGPRDPADAEFDTTTYLLSWLHAASCRVKRFIDEALAAGGRVLVHCGDGISRSPAIMWVLLLNDNEKPMFELTWERSVLHQYRLRDGHAQHIQR